MTTIYCDESGFTGYNLLDHVQPIFAVASACVSEEGAREILQTSFPNYQGAEFKFSNIWRTANRAGLVRFAEQIRTLEHNPFAYFIDKRFAVLTKAVDLLIEPYITDAGYDFYSDGFNWKYCNYIHVGLTMIGDPATYDALTRAYLAFSRDPTEQSLAQLQFQMRLMTNSVGEPNNIFFEQMAFGAERFLDYHSLDEFRRTNDLQTTTMLAVVGHWRNRVEDDLAIIHDASSNFLRDQDVWNFMTRMEAEQAEFIMGDGTRVQYPLRVASTTSADSRDYFGVQLSDMLAGLVTKAYNPGLGEDDQAFMQTVIEAGLDSVTVNGIRPTYVLPDQIPPRQLDGPDLVDRMRFAIGRSGTQ